MSHFRFENPYAFYWLWILPIVWVLSYVFLKAHLKRLKKFFSDKMYPFLSSSVSTNRRRWKLILESIVLLLFVYALARPQSGQSEEKVKSEGIEMMILFDVSQSMLAEDVKPSRLDFAKKELIRLIDSGSDKVGIIAFAGSGVLLSPITTDRNALKMYIESLSPDSVSTQGTDFSKALGEAKSAFERGGSSPDEKTAITKAIVVVSDGEDNELGANDAAEKLKDSGIRIFTLAVGTEKGGAIPVRDKVGNVQGYRRDKSGQVILTQTKGTVLKELAKNGGGSFYHLSYATDSMAQLRADLTKLEKAEFDSAVVVDYKEGFQVWLFFGIILAMIELLLGERTPAGRVWKGRFEVAQQ